VDVDRRTFLETCAVALPALASQSTQTQKTYIYASESWSTSIDQSPFVIGFLITRQPGVHIAAIGEIKRRLRYTKVLTHHGNDRYKLGCVRELMQYFAGASDLRFAASIVTAAKHDALRPPSVRVGAYPALFQSAQLPPGAILRVRRRAAGWGPPAKRVNGQSEYAARIKALQTNGLIARGEEIALHANDGLVELSSVLNGTLFRAKLSPTIYSDAPMRVAMATRIQSLLNLDSIEGQRAGKWEPMVVTVG